MGVLEEAFEAVVAKWSAPASVSWVSTRLGETRVIACGEGDPIVLLPGSGATAASWFGVAGRLPGRVYAVDLPGTARTLDDLMSWVDAVLARLEISRVVLCAHSYGAWLALNYALRHPAAVSRLALLDPTDCFTGLSLPYRIRAVPLMLRPSGRRQESFLRWETTGRPLDPDWLRLVRAVADLPSPHIVFPRRPNLLGLTVQTLVLIAADGRAHDPRRVAERAAHQPAVTAELLDNATHHSIPVHEPDVLAARITRWLVSQG
ncbi:alpha/beta fold hydrolase [Amycolatopsis sp. FDAARGOS 1241]|uniref:alpha/beta fold hydrolase n=1 Tax=Amycolatopsis sp. FDAARGOS 1241 TaxID=2778070 RepID=UPI0019514128|nr:alpha/beta hydrolase [Amycolatopsis sp. FDAARGOS 1241]QRP49703.1 alpha/beta hydrolase [Amycolatopsis sp. FDAARGOS 1241]